MTTRGILCLLGGGSVWTPYFLRELSRFRVTADLQIRLHGPTESHLRSVCDFTQSIVPERLDITTTSNIEEAVTGATIVINQVRIDGWEARIADEIFAAKIGAVGDESLGLGGFLGALRAWDFIRRTSRLTSRLAPECWILNLTNPSDLTSRCWREGDCPRVIGLCDYPQRIASETTKLVGTPRRVTDFGFLGISHVGWLTPSAAASGEFLRIKHPLEKWMREWGAVPTPWRITQDSPEEKVSKQRNSPGARPIRISRLTHVLRNAILKRDCKLYNSLLCGRPPDWYTHAVIPAVAAILGGKPARLVVGLPNRGRLNGLAPDVQIETRAILESSGVTPDALPRNMRCRNDVRLFGRSRDLAFKAVTNPTSDAISRYAEADPFVRTEHAVLITSRIARHARDRQQDIKVPYMGELGWN